ncbi:hypothetical protein BH10PLA2_BH10PLA2_00310 [soil metagenome]
MTLGRNDDYTRAAALLARDLDVYNLVDGKANTFLVQPITYPKAVWFAGNGISPMFLAQTGWVEIADYMRAAPMVQVAQTALIPAYCFDEHFDKLAESTDGVIAAAARLKDQLTELRPQMRGER